VSPITVGLDVGDRRTHFSACGADRKSFGIGSFPTTKEALLKALRPFPNAKVVLEAGSQSPWMSRVLRAAGYDVQVADPRRVQLISQDARKSDRRDTVMLMRMGAAIPEVLGNIHHRGELAQAHLSILRARDLLVRMRTMAVQQVRGLCKAFGVRLPRTDTSTFAKRVVEQIPDVLHAAVLPILQVISELTERVRAFEKALAKVAEEHYPEVERLQQVNGVGPVISVGYVLSIEDPKRFARSRSIGSWLGLCPRSKASGDSNPQLRISKCGDARLRRLLVQGAQQLLGPFGADCDLRRYGLHLAARGGKAAKKRAVVAVARKLAILLHRLWVSGADYEPLRNANRQALATAN
jgi:transposase